MDTISSIDNISRLFSLQASSKNSVVSEEKLSSLQSKMYIESKLDAFLKEYCINGLEDNETKLVILSGNAGDGKSMALRKLKDNLKGEGINKEKIYANADATQTDSPNQNLNEKLISFFNNFLRDHKKNNPKIYIIAMNVGIAIKFFNSIKFRKVCEEDKRFCFIKNFIFNELNIRKLDGYLKDNYEELHSNILVVNFDLRCLVNPNINGVGKNQLSFFRQMIERIYELVDMNKCNNCKSNSCPIYFNLVAFQSSKILDKIENILFKVFLYNKVHLTPRNVWDFIYIVLTGGEPKYINATSRIKEDYNNPCDFFNKNNKDDYFNFLFYNNIFDNNSENAIFKFIRSSIEKFDPTYIGNKELELLKILANSNSEHFLEVLKEKASDFNIKGLNSKENLELIFKPIIRSQDNFKSKLMKNICRYIYFFNDNDESKIQDILVTDFSQILDSNYFNSFYKCLKAEREMMLNKSRSSFDTNVLKMIRSVLVSTFGSKLSDQRIIQLETVTTRSKGRLLGKVKIKMDTKPHVQSYWQDSSVVEALDFFPNQFTVMINENYYLEVTLDLFELIVLANSGYNISSIDLERFNQLEVLSKKLMSQEIYKDTSIFYEINHEYYKLEKDIGVEFRKIK
ncbi:hypothetical protein [Halonatronum saccharophilum]|uniref:hypothetical protein n=1 Tax=Halonatronum saccharophilum TaxID=150060 RepID=UPI000484BBC2|nr:hypothetical protein [Halonatronum saccharophilum]